MSPWKALPTFCAAAQQDRAVSQQDLGGYIYIILKGHHLEQQETWCTHLLQAGCLQRVFLGLPGGVLTLWVPLCT